MLNIILNYLPYLFLAIVTNIALGTYNNVAKLKEAFKKDVFFGGILKALIISIGFISTAIIYDKIFGVVEIGELEIKPDVLIISAILMYFVKAVTNLKDILKVDKIIEIKETPVEEEPEIEIER